VLKNPLSPGAVAAIIVVFVALLAVFGWRYLSSSSGGGGSNTNPYDRMPAGMTRPMGSGGRGFGSGGSMPGGPRGMGGASGGAPTSAGR